MFDAIAEVSVYVLLLFAPMAFGAVQAWSHELFVLLVAAAAVCVGIKHVLIAWAPDRFGDGSARPAGYVWSWVYPLAAVFLVVCGVQAVPLPAGIVQLVSPNTIRLKAELLADLPNVSDLMRRVTVSFYPHATIEQVILVGAIATLFAVVVDVFRTPERIRRLLSVVVVAGLAVAAVAIYQNLTGTATVYGLDVVANANTGPLLNYSHFSQFTNLSAGAALGLLLDRLAVLGRRHAGPGELWVALRDPRNAAVWLWATLCVAGPVTILLAMSRMGMLSMFAAAVFTTGMLIWRGRSVTGTVGGRSDARGWLVIGLALGVFLVLLAVGFDAVAVRLASLHDVNKTDTRAPLWRGIVAEFHQFPWLGTGLGTHQFVFGQYDQRNSPTIATHAENEYLQVLEETGTVGLLPVVGFVALVVVNYARGTRRPTESIDYVAFGLGFGLLAILIHSASDFGQHVPAIAALTATLAAVLSTLARRRRSRPPTSAAPAVASVRRTADLVAHVAGLAAILITTVAATVWTDRARAAESFWLVARDQAAGLQAANWSGSDAAYVNLLTPAAAAVTADPTDAVHRYWTDTFRWHALARQADPATGNPLLPTEAIPFARQIADDLDVVRTLCPAYGQVFAVAGQIDVAVLGRVELGEHLIRIGYRLSPYDRGVCLIAGLGAVRGRQWDDAADIFGHYVQLGGAVNDFADPCLHAGHPQIPYHLAGHDRGTLLYLASRMPAGDAAWAVWIDRCRSEAAKQLAIDAARPDAPAWTLAEQAAVDAQQGRFAEAVDLYRRAVAGDFANVGWHVELARSLATLSRYTEAADELRLCLRLRPDATAARDLLVEYEARAVTGGGPGPTTAP